jgi:cytochrome c553
MVVAMRPAEKRSPGIGAIPWWNDGVNAGCWLIAMCTVAGLMRSACAGPARIEDTLTQRLAACTTCHGKEGRAATDGYHPRIAGKPAAYLYNQLRNFQDGRRQYGAMVSLVDPLPDAYLREIADHFAALDPPYDAPPAPREDTATLARGRALVLQGDAARQLPACTACHGAALTGRLPATPGLLGLPRDYLVGQLGAWVNGQRRALAPDCMAAIAQRLSGPDLTAVAAWLASQPVPSYAHAAPASQEPPPMACGSVPQARP